MKFVAWHTAAKGSPMYNTDTGEAPEEGDYEAFTMQQLKASQFYKHTLLCIQPCRHWFDANETMQYYQHMV